MQSSISDDDLLLSFSCGLEKVDITLYLELQARKGNGATHPILRPPSLRVRELHVDGALGLQVKRKTAFCGTWLAGRGTLAVGDLASMHMALDSVNSLPRPPSLPSHPKKLFLEMFHAT
jgi:hypothetical protein